MFRSYHRTGSVMVPLPSTCLLRSVIHNSQITSMQTHSSISKCTVCQSYRFYTPIFQPEPVTDNVARVRASDEANVLWTVTPTVDSLPRAVEVWLRFGNDPVMHTSIPPQLPRLPNTSANVNEILNKEAVNSDNNTNMNTSLPLPSSCSPFAYAEDYMGTNLVSGSSEQLRESTALWNDYFEHKYTSHMRQSRRTATNYIGLSTAADVFNDEADSPNTTWSQDIVFQELSYLSQKFLKVKVTDMLEFEHALWFTSTAENFLHLFDNYQQQTFTRIPLPSPSVWIYEGAARKQWVENYLPASHASRVFFDSKINPALVAHAQGSRASEQLLQKVADALKRVHEIELRRAERQVREAIRPSWTSHENILKSKEEEEGENSSQSTTDADKQQSGSKHISVEMETMRRAWTDNEMERYQRAIQEGTYDPEDLLDSSESWKEENQAIEQVMQENINGYSFSLHDFWLHCIRREELETMHVLDNDRLRSIAAIARHTLYHELTLPEMYKDVRESIRRGQIDVRAAVFKPFVNHTYCKLHYAKFGASSMVQHTQTASRQLLFHQSASIYEVRATANLYFATKPLSSHLDYSSPYTLRRSLSKLCATYGIDGMFAQQRPVLLSCAYLAKAENLIQQVKCEVERECGEHRRRRQEIHHPSSGSTVTFPLTNVRVVDLQSELLDRGESMDRVTASTSVLLTTINNEASHGNSSISDSVNQRNKEEERSTMWPLGSRKAIRYHWPIPQLEKMRFVKQAGSYLTAARAKELEELRQSAHLEISLWRRRTHEELEAMRLQSATNTAQVNALIQRIPELGEVKNYIESFYDEISVIPTRKVENSDKTNAFNKEKKVLEEMKEDECCDGQEEWEFAVMLDDYALLNEDEVSIVYLPYVGANDKVLLQGEYKVCIRAFFDSSRSNSALGIPPTPYDVAFSESFPVFDAVPQLCEQFCQEHHLSNEQITLNKISNAANSNNNNNNNSKSAKMENKSNSSNLPSTEVFTLANFTLLPGELLIPFCEFLRDAGLDVPLRTEFMAGQVLDTHGNVLVHAFLERLRGSHDHQSLADAHLTQVQRNIEACCRAHWQLYWPGAKDVEWARVRRDVLNDAMMEERDWWLPDPLLSLDNEMCAGDTTQSTSKLMYRASMRYANELCQALKARGASWHRNKLVCTGNCATRVCNKDEKEEEKENCLLEQQELQKEVSCAKPIEASCTVDGTGAVCQLAFHKCDESNSSNYGSNPYRESICYPKRNSEKNITHEIEKEEMSSALNAALMAIQDAHNRHCTLATCKVAPFEKYTQMLRFCEADLTSCGGKYARTYAYAFGKAQAASLQIEEQGRIQPGNEDKDTIRLSEMTHVDRFASTTHPEQRKKLFEKRVTLAEDDLDDPTPDLTSTWNR